MVSKGNEWHDIYHNFSGSGAPVCIFRLVETLFPAESIVEPIHGKANGNMFNRLGFLYSLFPILSEVKKIFQPPRIFAVSLKFVLKTSVAESSKWRRHSLDSSGGSARKWEGHFGSLRVILEQRSYDSIQLFEIQYYMIFINRLTKARTKDCLRRNNERNILFTGFLQFSVSWKY